MTQFEQHLITKSRLIADLRKLGLRPGQLVMLHASEKGRSGKVGQAQSYIFDAAELVRFAVQWMERRFRNANPN